jgi:hypothetical protein
VKVIGLHGKVCVDAIWLVDDERAFAVAVVSDVELFTDVFQGENVRDGFGVKPNVAVVCNVRLYLGGQSATIAMDGHGLIRGLPYTGDKLAVAEEINCRLAVEENHVAEIHRSRDRSCAESEIEKLVLGLAFVFGLGNWLSKTGFFFFFFAFLVSLEDFGVVSDLSSPVSLSSSSFNVGHLGRMCPILPR